MSEERREDHRSPEEGRPARRGSHRRPISGILVAIDAPSVSDQPWVCDAIDINAHGMGLVLPPEIEIPEGTEVFLSFKLEDGLQFSRVPAVVRHHDRLSSGIRFRSWPGEERLKLLEYLVSFYESEC